MAVLSRHRPGAGALRSIARLALAAAAVLLLGGTRLAGQASRAPEYQVKAVFLFNFAQFVEWPPDPGADPAAPLVIGVLGEDPFGSVLDETVRGERLGQRPFRVMRYRRVEEIERCDILFISRSEARIVDDILAQLALRPILTVAEIERFAERGGMVRFLSDRGHIRLQIQRGAAEAAGLQLSSKLLRVAEVVERGSR